MSAALGLGTYRVRAVEQAARTACQAGCGYLDTAPNYGHSLTHQALAPVLADHPKLCVTTKTGFHSGSERLAAVAEGVLTESAAAHGHSLDPAFVRWQTSRSLAVLGRADIVFVHNPEHHHSERTRVHAALRRAFRVLEDFARRGLIGGYGVATWSGFSSGAFTVAELVELAAQAADGGEHHLVGIQLPVSLVMIGPLAQALDGTGPLAEAAAGRITTFASAPLHGGELPPLMTPELVDFIRPGLTPAAAALLAVASCPALDVVLLGASTRAHWDDAAAVLSHPLTLDHLRSIAGELAEG